MSRRFLSSMSILLLPVGLVILLSIIVTQWGAHSDSKAADKNGPKAPSGVWTDIATFPPALLSPTPGTNPLKIKRAAAVSYFPNGKVYLLGGRHGVDGDDWALSRIMEYTPGNPGTWTTKAAQVDPGSQGSIYTANMAAGVLTDANGVRIYAIGGSGVDSTEVRTVRVYDPVADSITTLSGDAWPITSTTHIAGGYAVYNNKMYLFGGFTYAGVGGVYTDTWRFDPMAPAGQKWTQMANLNLGRGFIASAVVDGKLYAVGGDTWNPVNKVLVPVTNVEMLDLTQGSPTWVNVASLPTARGDMGAWGYNTGTGYEISGRVAVAGGHYEVPDNVGYMYNPGTNSWATFPNFVHATRDYGYTQFNGFLYAFGGYDYGASTPNGANFNQQYDASLVQGTPTPTRTGTPPTATGTSTTGAQATNTPTRTATPVATTCSNYSITSSTGATVVPATTFVAGSNCDDCSSTIALPFPFTLYGQTFNSLNAISNGNVQFSSADTTFTNTCLPYTAANYAIMPHWDDLLLTGTNQGIYTLVEGTSPNRVFDIEWKGGYFSGGGTVDFEVRLFEGSTSFEVIYGTVTQSGSSATVGVQKDTGSLFAQFECNTGGLSAGQKLTFTLPACGTGTPGPATATRTATSPPAGTATRTPTTGPTNTTGPATPTPCGGGPIVVTGAIDTSDPTQTNRLFRGGVASTCGVPNACSTLTGTYHYDLLGPYVNTSGGTVCITVTLDTLCTGTNFIFSGGYVGPFDPANICTNNVGDPGSSPNGAPVSYGFDVPSGGTFYVNVAEVTANAGCSSYTVTITGLPGGACVTATPTSPPVSTSTPTNTPTNTPTGPVPPTNTPTRTPTGPVPPTNTPTDTPQPTQTPGGPTAIPTATSTICPITFTDVPVGSTFYTWIRCLACRGIINGYPDGTFRPNNDVTRGQLSKIVSNSAGFSEPAGAQQFEDVLPGSTFYDYIWRLADRGYINGYPCGTVPSEPCVPPDNRPYFRTNNNATRGQISKIVSNAAGFIEPVTGQTFEDVPVGSTFYDFIERLASRGVMSGYPCGSVPSEPCVPPDNRPYFRPSNNATRGQTSKIVANTFFPNCDTPAASDR